MRLLTIYSLSLLFFAPPIYGALEDKIEVEVVSAKQVGQYGDVQLKVKNQSDKVITFFGKMKAFDQTGQYLAEGMIQADNLGPGKEDTVQVPVRGVNLSAVKSWAFSIEFPSSVKDRKGDRVPDGEKRFLVVEVNKKSSLPLPSQDTQNRSTASSGCDADKVKMSFFRSCKFAGISRAESTGRRPDNTKIEQVCRCIATNFNVERLDSLLKGGCEYSIPAAQAVAGFDKTQLQCGTF